MRKLFAMVATVAVVLSMFSGIAFAADTTYANTEFRVVLTCDQNSVVTTGSTPGFYIVTGQVYAGSAKLDNTATINNGIVVTTTGDTTGFVTTANINPNGTFTYAIPTNGSPADYAFQVVKAADPKLSGATNTLATAAHFYRKATVEFSKTEFAYSTTALDVLTLTVRNASGALVTKAVLDVPAISTTTVALGDAVLSNMVVADGYIAFVVTNWTTPGEKILTINGVAHGTVKVGEVSDLALTVSPRTSIKNGQLTPFEFKVTGPASLTGVTLKVTGPAVADTTTYIETAPEKANLEDLFAGTYVRATGTTVHYAAKTIALDTDGKYELDSTHDFTVNGTYTITASKTGYGTAEVKLSVVTAADGLYEYVRSDELTTVPVGTTTVTIGAGGDYEVIGVGTAAGTITYEVYVNGTKQDISGGSFTIDATKIGKEEVRIMTFVNGVKKLDKVYSVSVTGWDIAYDVTSFVVNKAQTVTFTVKDSEGKAINNAQIYYVDAGTAFSATAPGSAQLLVNPTQTNISDGKYSKSLKLTTTGQKDIYVVKPATSSTGTAKLMAKFEKGFNVTGEPVYTVASDVKTLLAGKQEKVTLTVTENGVAIIPVKVEMQVGSTITNPSFTVVGNTVKVTVLNSKAKDATIRVMNASGAKAGEVVLNTVAPKLVVLNTNTAITENINTALNFKVVDPRNDAVISEEITLSAVNFTTVTVKTADKKGTLTTALSPAAAQDIVILAENLDWDNLKEFNDVPKVTAKIQMDALVTIDGSFEVKKAEVTSSPESVVLGQPANITLTYKDANGNVVANKKVYVGYVDNTAKGTEIGTTDDKGQIVYASNAQSSAALSFGFATDVTAKQVKKTVTSVLDTTAPVVTAPATSDKNTAIITISDNARVTTLYVNGVKLDVIPRATLTHVVTLKQGENKIDIVAIDSNFNVAEQTVTITRTAGTSNSVVLKGSEVATKGNYTFVQLAKFEQLGATKSWNATTKTATFTFGGKTVSVTIGSTTAKVDGKSVAMPVAPYLANGSTMVPTRFIAENLGWKVDYAGGVITITLP